MDPAEFLFEHEPFRRLGAAGRARIVSALEIEYAGAGDVVLVRGGEPARGLYVVRKGSVRLEVDGRIVDELGSGEPFGFPSLIARTRPHFDVVCASDCLLYCVPAAIFHDLVDDEVEFGAFFRGGLAERLRHATSTENVGLGGDLAVPVERLVSRPPIFVERDARVGEAAQVMRDQRVSSVLVRGEPLGILTDRDLRSRVLAEGRGPQTPVVEVMSSPLITVEASAPVLEAMVLLLDRRLHHLPLERQGEIVGLVTHSDLLRHQTRSPGFVLRRILREDASQAPGTHSAEIAAMVEGLHQSGLRSSDIARLVATVNDTLVERALREAESELGAPPCPYAWIVFGSEGRREQLLLTDQDNALVYAEASDGAAAYFAQLGRRVVDALVQAGFPECKGGFMATNWCHPLDRWESLFRGWVERPDPQALMDVANLFDFRALHGELDLAPLERIIAGGRDNQTFLGQLARTSLRMRPPIGLFHRIKQGSEGIDLKTGGVVPVVGLARVYALESGTRERSTLGRLAAARSGGQISGEGADLLTEGFRFLLNLRLREQLKALREGREPVNHVRLEALERVDARHLKETFLEIRQMQQAMAQRYQVELLG